MIWKLWYSSSIQARDELLGSLNIFSTWKINQNLVRAVHLFGFEIKSTKNSHGKSSIRWPFWLIKVMVDNSSNLAIEKWENTLPANKQPMVKNNQKQKNLPFVSWKMCRAHLSAASLTGVLPSFKHSASAGPTTLTWPATTEGFACNIIYHKWDP